MKKILALLIVSLLAGCAERVVSVPVEKAVAVPGEVHSADTETVMVKESQLTDKQKIALLRAEAKKRGIRWRIWCVSDNEQEKYQGWAVQQGDDFFIYAEEGAKDNWTVTGPTQADTAMILYEAIQGEPNFKAQRLHPHPKEKICKPEIQG